LKRRDEGSQAGRQERDITSLGHEGVIRPISKRTLILAQRHKKRRSIHEKRSEAGKNSMTQTCRRTGKKWGRKRVDEANGVDLESQALGMAVA
jgi:hypothetical protein